MFFLVFYRKNIGESLKLIQTKCLFYLKNTNYVFTEFNIGKAGKSLTEIS